jgi:LuxR family transcriptional regulator, activator of tox operons
MLLNTPPSNRDTDPLPVTFKSMGDVVEVIGTPDFVPQLARFLNSVIPIDVAHVERSRVDDTMPSGYRCEWIGSSGIERADTEISEVMTLYYERFQANDPLFAGIRGKTGTLLVVRDIEAIPAGEFRKRIYDDVAIGHECVLARGTRYAQLSIALERSLERPSFSLEEMRQFPSVSDFLFPALELHASTTAARLVAQRKSSDVPLTRFDAMVAAGGIRLSRREYEACKHFISGKTVPETAEILGVRLASVESYAKRAFAKLGVNNKRELVARVTIACEQGSVLATATPVASDTFPG